jgi:probable HAF family extracellular repeat protein
MKQMKTIMAWLAASSLLAASAIAQQAKHYTVTDLGAVGNAPGQPYFINNRGFISGAAASSATVMHAVLWYGGQKFDIGSSGLGGPNSAAFGVNVTGQAVGEAESSVPNGEDFCGFNAYGFPSGTACVPFLWQNGVMAPLPTLGGVNGVANGINGRGQVAGYVENQTHDPGCPVFEFKPVLWEQGKIRQLPTFVGDAVGGALAINEVGQSVGISGPCAAFDPNLGLYMIDVHALLWQNGVVTDLGNLGGDGLFGGNHACAINNLGQVVGHSDLTDDATFHGYLWTQATGMMDLGTLAGDFASLALGINDGGVVVGMSLAADFSPRAFLWQNGVMTDLNTLIPAKSGLYLLQAKAINASGEITGFGVNANGEVHGFLATPR